MGIFVHLVKIGKKVENMQQDCIWHMYLWLIIRNYLLLTYGIDLIGNFIF